MIGNEIDVFRKFMNKEGKLKLEKSRNIKGLIGLYEASQLSMEGEDILDEVGEYSAQLLNKWKTNLDHHQARTISNTLIYPYHKSLPSLMVKNYIHDHEFQNRWVTILKEPALIELSFVRNMQN